MLSGAGGSQPQAPGAAPDFKKFFKQEAENLALAEGMYKWVGDGIEDRLLKQYGKAV